MQYYDDKEKILGLANYQKTLLLIASNWRGQFKCRTKSFSGVKTLLSLRIKESPIFEIDFQVISGKAKLVAIQNNEITTLSETHFNGPITTILHEGKCRIRLVGENAEIKLTIRKL